jgi:hypothetical protein
MIFNQNKLYKNVIGVIFGGKFLHVARLENGRITEIVNREINNRESKEEEKWALVDPLLRLERYMKKMNIWNIDKDKLKEEYKQEIDAQFVSAENEKAYKIGDVFDYMYTDMPEDLMRQKDAYEQYLSWKENRK